MYMEWVGEGIRKFACYLIFLSVVVQILPQSAQRRYIRTFLGMLLLLSVLHPFLSAAGIRREVWDEMLKREFQQEALGFRRNSSAETGNAYLEHACRRQMEVQIRELAEAYGYRLHTCAVSFFPGEDMELEGLDVELAGDGDRPLDFLKKQLSEVYNLPEGNINVSRQGLTEGVG